MDARDTPALPASAPHRHRRPALLALCCALALAAATFLALGLGWLTGGAGGVGGVGTVAGPGAAPAAAAVRPSGPLTVTVAAPGPATAGRPVRLVVTYADGSGFFSGSTEDWGDGVGASSLAEDRCGPAAASAGPVAGSYRAVHTWAKPGTYTVRIAVSSYTCAGTEPVEEQATATVTVEVTAS